MTGQGSLRQAWKARRGLRLMRSSTSLLSDGRMAVLQDDDERSLQGGQNTELDLKTRSTNVGSSTNV